MGTIFTVINTAAFLICVIYFIIHYRRLTKLLSKVFYGAIEETLEPWQAALIVLLISIIPGLSFMAAVWVIYDYTEQKK